MLTMLPGCLASRQGLLRHGEDAADIGRHHRVEIGERRVDRHGGERDAGIVDERVEGCVERVETGLDGGFVGDVEGDGARGCRAGGCQFGNEAVEFLLAPRAHRDPGAVAGAEHGEMRAEPG